MPRIARVVIPDCPHHITQRGNRRQKVFFLESDKLLYLELLKNEGDKVGIAFYSHFIRLIFQQLKIKPFVTFKKKNFLPTISSLCNMMKTIRNDDSGYSGHFSNLSCSKKYKITQSAINERLKKPVFLISQSKATIIGKVLSYAYIRTVYPGLKPFVIKPNQTN